MRRAAVSRESGGGCHGLPGRQAGPDCRRATLAARARQVQRRTCYAQRRAQWLRGLAGGRPRAWRGEGRAGQTEAGGCADAPHGLRSAADFRAGTAVSAPSARCSFGGRLMAGEPELRRGGGRLHLLGACTASPDGAWTSCAAEAPGGCPVHDCVCWGAREGGGCGLLGRAALGSCWLRSGPEMSELIGSHMPAVSCRRSPEACADRRALQCLEGMGAI
jgi:hypothetical protein